MSSLTLHDCDVLLQAIGIASNTVWKYDGYPSPQYKKERLAELSAVKAKVAAIREDATAVPE